MAVIKTRGSKPAKKSAAKKAPAKKATTKSAAGRKGAAKTNAKSTKTTKAKAKPESKRDYRSPKTEMSQTQLNKFLKPLAKHAEKRDKHYDDWKTEVAETNTRLIEALNAGVPVNLIVEAANVARQHVYKLLREIDEGKRTKQGVAKNPSGRQPNKPAAKKAAAKKGTAKAKTTAKKGAAKPAAKKASGKKLAAKKSGKKTIKRK